MTTLLNGHVIDRQLMTRIEAIDLSNTRARLIVKKGYDPAVVDQAIADYRIFLYVCIQFEGTHEPTEMVDEVWHDHILHTQQYMADCQRVAGRYIHHGPYKVEWNPELGCAECSGTTNCQDEKAKASVCSVGDTGSDTDPCFNPDKGVALRPYKGDYRVLVGLAQAEAGCNGACGDVQCGTCSDTSNCASGFAQVQLPVGAVANKTCGEGCGWCSNK